VSAVPPPRVEGVVTLADGRNLGLAEYGPAGGRPVLWFHGTPGGRRQVPDVARTAAAHRNVRLIAIERPGAGASTPHLYESVLGWARDVEEVMSRLELGRVGLVGLSGGGPYVLACAYHMPDRVAAGAVLGGVAPSRGDDASPGGIVGLAAGVAPLLEILREPLGRATWLTAQMLRPVASQVFDLYMRLSPEGDRRVFARPEMKEMFLDDLVRASRRRLRAPVYDLVLFTRPWGFSPREIRVPITFWHGDADNIVPLAHGQHLAGLVPRADLRMRADESHLGSLEASPAVLDALLAHWPDRRPGLPERDLSL
jgi:pimeloyl-ACP methyl ester carboxylesterase